MEAQSDRKHAFYDKYQQKDSMLPSVGPKWVGLGLGWMIGAGLHVDTTVHFCSCNYC